MVCMECTCPRLPAWSRVWPEAEGGGGWCRVRREKKRSPPSTDERAEQQTAKFFLIRPRPMTSVLDDRMVSAQQPITELAVILFKWYYIAYSNSNSHAASCITYYLFLMHFPLQTKNIYNKADGKPCITPRILTFLWAKRRLGK